MAKARRWRLGSLISAYESVNLNGSTSSTRFLLSHFSKLSSLQPTLRQGIGVSALLWWLAGLPFGGFALGWIALTPLLWSLESVSPRARFFAGWKCGICAFALVNWWIILAVTRGANVFGLPAFIGTLLGILSVFIIAVVHGLGFALVALIWNTSSTRCLKNPFLWPLFAAATWMFFDWMRCEGVLAHSWGAPAFSQTSDLALLQIASIVGQHGLSFLCVWLSASCALWLSRAHDFRFQNKSLWIAPLVVLFLLHVWGAMQLRQVPNGQKLRVLLVQTAAQSGLTKMQSAFAQAYEQTFRAENDFDLVVWPETTFRVTKRGAPKIEYSIGRDIDSLELRQIAELCRAKNISILAGVDATSDDLLGKQTRSNEAMLIARDGSVTSRGKSHLVPFGEVAPFVSLLPWLSNLAPTPSMTAGTLTPLRLKNRDVALGALICFESCFREPSHALSARSRALFVLTNDEWFSGSEAPAQHLAMSQMRAVENRRWVAQSANGGYTFAINSHGRVVAQSRFGKSQALSVEMRLATP